MNLGTIAIAQTANPLSLAHVGSRHLTGFLSLLSGLLDQGMTATPGEVATQPEPAGAPSLAQGTTTKATSTKAPPTTKEKGDKTGNAPRPVKPLGSAASATTPQLLVPTQSAKTSEAATLQTMISSLTGESPAILTRAATQGSSTATGAESQDAAASSPSIPLQLSPSSVPLSSVRDLAFALRLTWQPPDRAAEAAIPSGTDSIAPRASEISPSNAVLNQAVLNQAVLNENDKPAAIGEAATSIDLVHAENPQATIQPRMPGASAASTATRQAEDSLSLKSASLRSTGADPVPQNGAGSRNPDVAPAIHASKANAVSVPQNGESLIERNSSTRVSSKEPLLAEMLSNSTEFDSQPGQIAQSAGVVPAKSVIESGQSVVSHGFMPRTDAQTVTPISQAQYPESESNESATPRPRFGATSGTTTTAVRPVTAANDSENTKPQNARNDDVSPESDGKATRALPAQKLSEMQATREHAGTSDGVLPGQPAEPVGAPTARTKILASQPSPTPAVSPQTEAPRAGPTQPIREVSLRLTVATSTPVDVQLAQRDGKVQVAVRTPDQDLAKSLQSNLGELVGRLEEKGFKTDVSTPVNALHDGLTVREPSTSPGSQSHSGHSGTQGGQPDSRGGQQESDQRQQARWKAQFEDTLSAPSETDQAGLERKGQKKVL